MDPGWWPTKGSAKRDEYAGAAACQACHTDIFEKQKTTPMAHASRNAEPSAFGELAHGPLQFHLGPYTYELRKTADGAVYSVNDGSRSISVPIGWILGNAEIGRTYVYQQNGDFFESRLSYYRSIQGLDFTTGNPRSVSQRLEAALGRHMPREEVPFCFGCHSTASKTSDHFNASRLMPGVTCEACHGPGVEHVVAMNLGQYQPPTFIMNPAQLDPVASVDYCGACHRTSVDVTLMGIHGMPTLRFPAYRLERSRCWKKPDSRLTCMACHDPHQPLVRDPTSYDKNCLACHRPRAHTTTMADVKHRNGVGGGDSGALTCPVGKTACVTCHMPKYQIPEMHATFTDHKIAVHRDAAFVE
jgi:hypothetical protein